MPDESLLALERALKDSPDDAATRLRLVSLLARSGRRREALSHAGLLQGSRDLVNDIWRDELAGWARGLTIPGAHEVSSVALDPQGALLAWSSPEEGLHVASVASGKIVHVARGVAVDRLLAVPGRIFADYRTGPGASNDLIRIGSVELAEGRARETRRAPPVGGGTLVDVSPGGDFIVIQGPQREGVYRWPGLEAIFEQETRLYWPVVEWHSRRYLVNGVRGLEVLSLEGSRLAPIPGRSSVQPIVLGQGLIARIMPGLVVHALALGWAAVLYELRGNVGGTPARPSLSGRFVRIVLGGTPVRFELDLATGAVVSRPDRVERLALAQTNQDGPGRVLWHPQADLVFQQRNAGIFELRDLDGATILRLPAGSAPVAWTGDGLALLVLRGAGEGKAWLELWRSP